MQKNDPMLESYKQLSNIGKGHSKNSQFQRSLQDLI